MNRSPFFVRLTVLVLSVCFFAGPGLGEGPPVLPTSLPIPSSNQIPKQISVALLIDVPAVTLATDGSYEITDGAATSSDEASISPPSLRGAGPFEAKIHAREQGFEVNRKVFQGSQLVFQVSNGTIQLEGRKYHNRIRILKSAEGKLVVINDIDLEEYLKGVLPLEVHPDWPLESLKAHAVVSRTFALFKAIEKEGRDFALHQTVQSQVYGGAAFHHLNTDTAVEATHGEILTVDGNIFPAYFHAACGGRTAQADRIWPVEPNRALKGVACSFCRSSKHWSWLSDVPLVEIETIMQKKGYPAKNLKSLRFLDRDESGRYAKALLEYKHSKVTILANDFRTFLGYERLKSLNVDVTVKNGRARFQGFGWGHGIGFCQWGAKGQAGAGKTYREILEFYFPGSEIKKV